MDEIVFRVGDYLVTAQLALSAAGGLIALVALALLIVAIVAIRASRRQSELVDDLGTMRLENVRLTATLGAQREQICERDRRIADLGMRVDEAQQASADDRALLAAARAQMLEQERQNEENLNRFRSARQQMTDEFKAIAGEVLQTHSATFTRQNREQVDLLLKPLGDKIEAFSTGLVKDRAEMIEQLRTLQLTSLEMRQEATNLTRALKNNSQVQGAWGEMILTSVLERSGLRQGEHFRLQQTHTGADGNRLRTDVEVLLPTGDVVIVDSKVSLTAFETFVNAAEEADRQSSLKAHVASLRAHVKTLASKDYHLAAESGLDFVVLFVPLEAAFSQAVTADPGLLDYAMGHKVIVTTPTTLMSVLRTIHNIWQIENRQKNAEEIAERAGRLYDKVAGFLDNMNRVDQSIERSRKAFDDARAQLATGSGSVLRQIEMLKELGARTNKSLPTEWVEAPATPRPRLVSDNAAMVVEGRSSAAGGSD
jgi:DNA recombination protein RmuC